MVIIKNKYDWCEVERIVGQDHGDFVELVSVETGKVEILSKEDFEKVYEAAEKVLYSPPVNPLAVLLPSRGPEDLQRLRKEREEWKGEEKAVRKKKASTKKKAKRKLPYALEEKLKGMDEGVRNTLLASLGY
jgi:hypothetical protein